MPIIPNTTVPGLILTSLGRGDNSSSWSTPAGVIDSLDGQTYSVSGLLAVPSGATNYLPPFFYPTYSTNTVTFLGVIGLVRGGTSVTLNVQQNGSNVTGLTSKTITTASSGLLAPTSTTTVNNLDYFAPVITAISGTPDGLSLTFVFQISV